MSVYRIFKLLKENPDLSKMLEKANQRISDLEHVSNELALEILALKNELSEHSAECKKDQEIVKLLYIEDKIKTMKTYLELQLERENSK